LILLIETRRIGANMTAAIFVTGVIAVTALATATTTVQNGLAVAPSIAATSAIT
jgi:hypothetical protein